MDKDQESRSVDANTVDPVKTLEVRAALLEWLYAQANAARWGLSRGHFAVALERSASKRLASGALIPPKLEEYLGALHLEDLALARSSRCSAPRYSSSLGGIRAPLAKRFDALRSSATAKCPRESPQRAALACAYSHSSKAARTSRVFTGSTVFASTDRLS